MQCGNRWNKELDVEGLIFNIQKFSIHDGPGIRTTVFLKGCPLRCPWCSNPESINPYPEVITKFDILCIHCDNCLTACGKGAIQVSESLLPGDDRKPERTRELDRDLCDRCMKCVEVCPSGALSRVGESKTVREVLKRWHDPLRR
jgi:pyruvate formate lyase activating enzyme